jgi:DNA-nicking Smr family endonuclease
MKRRLSHEEQQLWHGVTRSVTPKRRSHHSKTEAADVAKAAPEKLRPHKPRTLKPHPQPEPKVKHRPAPAPFDLTGLDGKRAARLKKGELDIGRRIDLHGYTLAAAHEALTRFIRAAHHDGVRLVLVVTGKSGALHREAPLWLREAATGPHIAAMTHAHIRHGGAGAIYVYLRARRHKSTTSARP